MEQGKSKDSKLSWFLSSLKQWLTTRHIADGGAFYHKVEAFPTCCLGKKWYKIKTKTSKSHKLGLCGWIYFIQRLSVRPPLSPSELFMPPRKRRFSPQIFLIQSRSLAAPAAAHCTACLSFSLLSVTASRGIMWCAVTECFESGLVTRSWT